jgi:uncharacterized protein (TIGR02145 family)
MIRFNLFKKSFFCFLLFVISLNSYAQSGIFFQAIARDNNKNPARDRKIYIQTNIIQTTPTGNTILAEEHQTNTDTYGVFSIMLGNGLRVGGTVKDISTIDWSNGPYYLNIKIAITPIAAINTWDYSKEWIDLGTTIFGTVPFAFYSANSAKMNEKLNIIDTTKMLIPYAKAEAVQTLSTTIGTKLSIQDTAAMLSFYTRTNYTDAALRTKFNVADTILFTKKIYTDSALLRKLNMEDTFKFTKQLYTDSSLSTKMNIFDTSVYAKQFYVDAALRTKFNVADTILFTKKIYTDSALLRKLNMEDTFKFTKQLYTDSSLRTKMNIFDTSVYAKQFYVDAALRTKFNVADTILFTKKIYTDSVLLTKLSITGSAASLTNFPILNQNTTGNAAFATTAIQAGTATIATKLAISRKINNVDFDGSGDITITAEAGTLTGNTLNSTVINSSLTSVGTLTNTIISGKLVVGTISAASNSAVLEASSTTQGFLPPRMTTTQRDAILSPATGLVIFNTTTNGLEFKSSNGWVLLTPSNTVSLPTVVIGMQQWTDKNLDVLTYRNGDIIPQVKDATAWAALTTGAWCYFNNDPANGAIYGKIYNWYAVNDPRGLAPQGWHIATNDELETLRNTLGGSTVAGAKMKATTRWISPNAIYIGSGATNESGFSALPGSYRDSDGKFYNFIGQEGNWWTASEYNSSNAYFYLLHKDTDSAIRGNANKKKGYSVRCVRD